MGPVLSKCRCPSLWRKCIYTELLVILAAFFSFLSWSQNLSLPRCSLAHCHLFHDGVCFILAWHGTDSNVAILFNSLLMVFAFLKSWKFVIEIIKLSSYWVLDTTVQIILNFEVSESWLKHTLFHQDCTFGSFTECCKCCCTFHRSITFWLEIRQLASMNCT